MLQFTDFQIEQYKTAQQPVIKDQINPEMFFIKGKSNLPSNKSKTLAQFQQELLQMVNNPALHLALRVFGQFLKPQKFEDIGIFYHICRCFKDLPLKRKSIYLVLISAKCQPLIERTVELTFQFR